MKISFKSPFFISVAALLVLTAAMFGKALFTSQGIVLSSKGADTYQQFIHWRQFGFSQLRQGNLALWNPYIFSGTPYLGEFQSALLYPLNIIYAFLPVHRAINISIALHIFLAGVFMYLWVHNRKLHPLACLLSSAMFMFCGAHFLHIYAGHLPNLCAIVWVPLIFLAIDRLLEYRGLGWCLVGMFAVLMQILAGHPQYVFYTAVAAAVYSGFCLIKTQQRLKPFLGIAAMYTGALFLGAVQILTAMEAASESVRTGGVTFEFASMFSFPPENLVTLLAPNFFGDNVSFPYWGRCYLWEMSLFMGVGGLILAVYGGLRGGKDIRRFSLVMTALLLLLALGSHTPLFSFLYRFVPGFNLFRGNSKFIFLVSLFIIMLAGIGMDLILRNREIPRGLIMAVLLAGAVFIAAGIYLRSPAADGFWKHFLQMVRATRESYLPNAYYENSGFIQKAGKFAAENLLVAGGVCWLAGFLFVLCRFYRGVCYIIAFLAIAEIFFFAKNSLVYFDLASMRTSELKGFADKYSGDYRVLYLDNPDSAMTAGIQNIWGYDPGILKRYAEFMTFTQGTSPDYASQYVNFHQFNRLYSMLRCRYYLFWKGEHPGVKDAAAAMPRLQLFEDWMVVSKRDDIFKTMQAPTFDIYKTVILETPPNPLPEKSEQQGTVRVIDSSTDLMTIEAELSSPAILLVTDAYGKGWRAVALPTSMQQEYKVMPANYILRAIPLSKGHHLFRLEYMPLGFRIGKWVSLIAVIIYAGLLIRHFRKLKPGEFFRRLRKV
jgi:hypothetical protein